MYQQTDPLPIQSMLAQQANGALPSINYIKPSLQEPDPQFSETSIPRHYDNIGSRENGFASRPDSKYGSPREDSRFLSLSPSARLSVLDAPLPASFDSQGISYMARHGPVAASLPSKMGIFESSPPASLPKKAPIPLDSVSNIGNSGFVGRESRHRGPDLGSSPFGSGDEGLGPRFLHSRRHPKPKVLSTSMPRVDIPIEDSDDDAFHFSGGEEDYIPTSIHDQVFTRDEQQRRYSRTEQDRRTIRDSLSGIGTPNDSSSKVSSPTTGSPSRYGPLFARQQQHQQQQDTTSSLATSPSAFGHIGSPLRNASLRDVKGSGDLSPSFPSLSSPPRQSSMSVLSQQLSRTRLSSKASEAATAGNGSHTATPNVLFPGPPISSTSTSTVAATAIVGSRHPSYANPHGSGSTGGPPGSRNLSSSSSQGQGPGPRRSEEEHDGVFPMEDDFDDIHRKRNSAGMGNAPNPSSSTSTSNNTTAPPSAPPQATQGAPAWSAIAAAAAPPGGGNANRGAVKGGTAGPGLGPGPGTGTGTGTAVGTRKGGGG